MVEEKPDIGSESEGEKSEGEEKKEKKEEKPDVFQDDESNEWE